MQGLFSCFGEMDKEKTDRNPQQFSGVLLTGVILISMLLGGVDGISFSADSDKEGIVSVSFSTVDRGFRSDIKERKLVTVKWRKNGGNFGVSIRELFYLNNLFPVLILSKI